MTFSGGYTTNFYCQTLENEGTWQILKQIDLETSNASNFKLPRFREEEIRRRESRVRVKEKD